MPGQPLLVVCSGDIILGATTGDVRPVAAGGAYYPEWGFAEEATGRTFLEVALTTTSSVGGRVGPRALGPSGGAERLHVVGEAHAHQLEAISNFADMPAPRADAHVAGEMVLCQLALVTARAS